MHTSVQGKLRRLLKPVTCSVVRYIHLMMYKHTDEAFYPHHRWQDGNTGIDESEVGKFSAMAASWWDPHGPMGPLHSMNPIRVKFIRQVLCERFRYSTHI